MFQNILEDIDRASSVEEVYPALIRLLAVISKMIARKDLGHAEAVELAEYVTNVRVLIAELASVGGGENSAGQLLATVSALKQCALELEGGIKEKRNDLARTYRERNP